MSYRNRIVGHGQESPDQLVANPRNWRIHPRYQETALAGSLSEVGWVSEVTVNQRTGFVLDGHLRVAHAISQGEATIPVQYVDLTEDEETLVLASLDPIAALATTDNQQLSALVKDMHTDNWALNQLVADILASSPRITTGNDNLNLSVDEKAIIYESGAQRQIMLLFTVDEYADVIWQFGQMMAEHPELETNTDIVKFLLTQAVGERDDA